MGSDLDVRNVPAAQTRRRLTPRSGLDRLSAEEVRCLAQRIEAGRAARDQLEGNETFDLAARRRLSAVAADGDEARSRLIAGNLRLVYSIARRYRHLPFDDAVAEGTVGLIKAADRFDWRKGFSMSAGPLVWRSVIRLEALSHTAMARAIDWRCPAADHVQAGVRSRQVMTRCRHR